MKHSARFFRRPSPTECSLPRAAGWLNLSSGLLRSLHPNQGFLLPPTNIPSLSPLHRALHREKWYRAQDTAPCSDNSVAGLPHSSGDSSGERVLFFLKTKQYWPRPLPSEFLLLLGPWMPLACKTLWPFKVASASSPTPALAS